MITFQSEELFGAFLVFVVVFIIILLLDLFYRQYYSRDVEKTVYVKHYTVRFHLKKLLARLLLKLNRREATPDNVVDKLQIFSDTDPMPVDAVFFNTSSMSRQIVVFSAAKRRNGLVNSMGFLRVPDFSDNLLTFPSFPDTSLYQTESEQKDLSCYGVAGLKITPVVPNREYHLEYNGKMRLESAPYKEVDIELNVFWRSKLPAFNFSTGLSKIAMSTAMALQPWSRKYFEHLKRHHQTHFEQYGDVDGVAKINGKDYPINTSGLRDRTFGAIRDWNQYHRYAIHMFRLDNGDAITVGVICVPIMFTRLVIGFVTKANDNVNIPIDNCSFDLNEYQRYNPPENYEFDFIANNDSYRVHVKRHTKAKIYMGEQSECCLVETWCDFKVNGIKGWGACEWQYKHDNEQQK
ncbi:uncharacterized protein LOC116344172 [Contarinia nasturtii]|uniref:uncharacterized protein LOC116344172 n=1 Tax=Contarinia nasturtii TaxID=265458 RepID=UPI0012D4663E|nr:uncharacterized protein LOC116344172 [Contarinia nasturtii]